MVWIKGAFKRREDGLSLIELLVVVAIIGILSTLTVVAVQGTRSSATSRGRTNDIVTVTTAVRAFNSEHPHSRYPTLDGCLPEFDLNPTLLCVANSGDAEQQMTVTESAVDVDINGDGDTGDTVEVVPIIWGQYFTGDDGFSNRPFTQFVDIPRHGQELVDGSSYTSNTELRQFDLVALIAPSGTADTAGTNVGICDFATTTGGACTVWVLNGSGGAVALLPGARY